MLRRKAQGRSHVQYILRTGCSFNKLCTAVCVCNKCGYYTIWGTGLRRVNCNALNRNDSEQFGVPEDSISDTPENDNRT